MRVMVIFTTPNKDICKTTWKLPNIKRDKKDSRNEGRRLVVYNGYKIFGSVRQNTFLKPCLEGQDQWELYINKFAEIISKNCKEIIESTNTDGEFLILIHDKPKDMLDKINLNTSSINNKKVYILDSHPYEKNGLIGSLADTIKENDGSGWIQAFDGLWSSCIKGVSQEEVNEILHLFLPLDIDMQALKILYDEKINGKNRKNPRAYLKEMYADNIDYVQKLKELQEKVNTIGGIEEINKGRLKKLAGSSNKNVDQFFEKLGDKEIDPDEFLGHSWGIDRVNSFHDWYCALSSCLRGAEGCEGK